MGKLGPKQLISAPAVLVFEPIRAQSRKKLGPNTCSTDISVLVFPKSWSRNQSKLGPERLLTPPAVLVFEPIRAQSRKKLGPNTCSTDISVLVFPKSWSRNQSKLGPERLLTPPAVLVVLRYLRRVRPFHLFSLIWSEIPTLFGLIFRPFWKFRGVWSNGRPETNRKWLELLD